MSRHLIVVDVETNGLDPERHVAFEVAWWNLTTDQRGRYVPPFSSSAILSTADVQALRVNRYIDRTDLQWSSESDLLRLWEQFAGPIDEFEEPPAWHSLAGSNPTFDAGHLRRLFARLNDEPYEIDNVAPWHHRLWDLSAYAAGVLGLNDLPGLAKVCQLLDVPAPDHTAEGDVTATGLCFRKLRDRAGSQQ